jgi:hypothetical protein
MVETRQAVVDQLEANQETMRLNDFVRIVEEHHAGRDAGGQVGVERDLLGAYADAVYFEVDASAIDEHATESGSWVDGDHFYEVGDGRLSVYPPDWHDALGGIDDLKHVIEVIQTETTDPEGDAQEAVTERSGVPEEKVLRVAETVAGIDREAAREKLKQLRHDDEIEEFASQHRNPTIRLR